MRQFIVNMIKYHSKEIYIMARTTYSPEFKAKVVLEVLQGDRSIDEVAHDYSISPNLLRNWKKEFIANASNAFNNSKVAKEARRKEVALEKEKTQMLKTIGQLTLERDFLQDCFRRTGRPVPQIDPKGQ